jgi:hypothetical protein
LIITKDLTLDEFLGSGIQQLGHILHETATGNENYRIKAKSGNFVLMNEADYNIQLDALRMLLQNAATIPDDWLKKFEPTSDVE